MKLFNLFLGALALSHHAVVVTAQLPANLSIVHINDHHSNVDELNLDLPRSMWPTSIAASINVNITAIRMKYGSFARVTALIKQLSAEATAAGFDVTRLHAGDAITGTNYFSFFGSTVDAAMLNLAGFDAMTLGNHEFDKGDKFLADFIRNLSFPILSANVMPNPASALKQANGTNLFRPYIIKTLANTERVGICGITTKTKTELSSFPDPGTTVQLEVTAATSCVNELTGLGINKIVLLTHIGYSNDLQTMATIPGVDVVVGGDSHTLLGDNATFVAANLFPTGPYATMVGSTCVVQAWEYGKIVGRLDVRFNAAGAVTSCQGVPKIPFGDTGTYQIGTSGSNFLNATQAEEFKLSLLARGIFANVTADAATAAVVAPFRSAISASGARVAGTANTSICHARSQAPVPLCPNRDLSSCLGGGGVCYLVTQGFLFNSPTADFGIQNSGGCRTDIAQGNITYSGIFLILPFANTLVTLRLTGAEVKAVLEDSINFFLNRTLGGGTGSFPFGAGLRWKVNYTAPFGSRFTDLEVNRRLTAGAWTPLSMTTTYTLVTNSFIGQGRDGYFTFLNNNIKSTYVDTFVEYAQSFINFVEARNNTPLNDPPLSQFSTQRINLLDGRQCDAVTGSIINTNATAPVAAPAAAPAVAPVPAAPVPIAVAPVPVTAAAPKAAPVAAPVAAAPVPAPTPSGQCPDKDNCRRNGTRISRKILGVCITRCVRFPRRFLRFGGWKCGRGCN